MSERRHDLEDARDAERDTERARAVQRRREQDELNREWRDADQPDGWRHSNEPALTDRERREPWPLG